MRVIDVQHGRAEEHVYGVFFPDQEGKKILGWTGAVVQSMDGKDLPTQVPMLFESKEEAEGQAQPDKNDGQIGFVHTVRLAWEE